MRHGKLVGQPAPEVLLVSAVDKLQKASRSDPVRDINRLIDPGDRIEWLGERFELWSIVDGWQAGGMVDWLGRPLVITKEPDGLVVHADVGRRGDFYPEEDPNDPIEVDIGDLWLEWDDDAEVAWLLGRDRGHLAEMCDRVAMLAPMVSRELAASEAAMEVPTTTFDERVEHGPWWSISASTDPS